MEQAGIGPTHVNHLLTSMNIPAVDDKLLRRREQEIVPVVEAVAKAACTEAPLKEVADTSPEAKGVTISYDMGWQKRGRAMNSLTGVGHAVGVKTGKIISYATRSKRCATCRSAEQRQQEAPSHDCRKNFSKSSKAMEADDITQIAKDLQDTGVKIAVMVDDDDSSAIKKLRDEFGSDIDKRSDLNHEKNFGEPSLCTQSQRPCRTLREGDKERAEVFSHTQFNKTRRTLRACARPLLQLSRTCTDNIMLAMPDGVVA